MFIMDISSIMDTQINVLDSVLLLYIEKSLCLVIFDDALRVANGKISSAHVLTEFRGHF